MATLALIMNTSGGLFTIASLFLSAFIIGVLVSKNTPRAVSPIVRFLVQRSMILAFAVALLAMLGSLVYSDVLGYEPCKLCWLQRIFIYPQVVILGIALWKRDQNVKMYSIALSVIGALVASYQYVGQLGWNPFGLECLASTGSACAKNFVTEFGFVTIPLMSLSIFLVIILIHILSIREEKNNQEMI